MQQVVDIATAVREAESVRRASAGELPGLATALARAFHHDPAVGWIIGDESRRTALMERGFGLYLRKLWFPQDECYTTESVAGTCVWERPGEWKVPLTKQLRLLPAMARIYGRCLPRLMKAITAAESNHPAEPHWYLAFVGVAPDWQGRGVGAALMRPGLDRCDAEGCPAYLEASSPRNRALYERHGFEVTEEFSLGKGSPPLWRMWRPPAAGEGAEPAPMPRD